MFEQRNFNEERHLLEFMPNRLWMSNCELKKGFLETKSMHWSMDKRSLRRASHPLEGSKLFYWMYSQSFLFEWMGKGGMQ